MSSWSDQFSEGDQGAGRKIFFNNYYSRCTSCKGKNIEHKDVCAGCRHNGDGYGTAVYKCRDCGWSTSFLYDESDTPYYYETKKWKQPNPNDPAPPKPVKVIGQYIKETKWLPMRPRMSDDDMRAIMLADGYTNDIISAFFAEQPRQESVADES